MKKSMIAVLVAAVMTVAGCGSFGVSAMDQKKESVVRTEAAEPIEHASVDAVQVRKGPAHVEKIYENVVTLKDDGATGSDENAASDESVEAEEDQNAMDSAADAENDTVTEDPDSADEDDPDCTADENDVADDETESSDVTADDTENDTSVVSESDYDGAFPYDEQNFSEGAEGPKAGTEIPEVSDVEPLPDDDESVSDATETKPFTAEDVEKADAEGEDVNLDELEAGGARAE